METENKPGPYALEKLRQSLHAATERASKALSEMTYEERQEAGRKAFLMFTEKKH